MQALVPYVRALGRRAPRWPTARWRALTDFLLIGAAKAGTTSLWRYLSAHPEVFPSAKKEVRYFDLQYDRGTRWYREWFPLERTLTRARRLFYPALFYPAVPARVRRLLPDAKFIVLLRDPVERAFSHFRMEASEGRETLSFEEAVLAEPERLRDDLARVNAGIEPSRRFRHKSYVERGLYAKQLERWFAHYDRDRFLLLRLEDLAAEPQAVYRRTIDFLGLVEPPELPSFKPHKVGARAELDPDVRRRVAAVFDQANQRLVELTGIDYRVPSGLAG
jgi:hypothetical protein